MSSPTPHIIKAQAFQIEMASREDAHRIQSTISALQSTRISQLIDSILSKYHDPEWVFSFDQVELDLGTVNIYNYENEIVYRLEEALVNFLKQSISKNGSIRRGEKRRLETRLLEQFEHFLKNGYLEWNSNKEESPSELLKKLILSDEIGLLASLKRLAKREQIRKRIVYQFDEQELEKIVEITAGSHSEYILAHKKNIVKKQQQDELVVSATTAFNKLVWEIIMAYLFAEGRSYFDKKSYLNYLITQIARHHNLTYSNLLISVSEGLKNTPSAGGTNAEFVRIIRELSSEVKTSVLPTGIPVSEEHQLEELFVFNLELFLNDGQFPKVFRSMSKTEFNTMFRHLLTKDEDLVRSSELWLYNNKKIKRLLQLLDSRSREELVLRNQSPLVSSAIVFLDSILIQYSRLPARRSQLITSLNLVKPEMILFGIPKSGANESVLMEELLQELCRQAENREDEIFELLSDRLEHIAPKHRKIVEGFLAEFYQKIGATVLDSIGNEVLEFLNSQPTEKWTAWFKQQLMLWEKITGLNSISLQTHIWNTLQSEFEDHEIIRILSAFPDDWRPKIRMAAFKEVRVTQSNSQGSRWNASLLTVLEHGKSPWWNPNYSEAQFNRDMIEFLSRSSIAVSEIRKVLRKSTADYHFVYWLYPETEKRLREVLVESSNKSLVEFLQTMSYELQSNFVLPGIISRGKFDELRKELLRLLVHSENNQTVPDVIKTLSNWISGTSVLTRITTRNWFIELLKTMSAGSSNQTVRKELKEWVKGLLKRTEPEKESVSGRKTLSEYLAEFNIELYESGSYTYYDDILSMIADNSVPFEMLLGKLEFRQALMAELSIPETRKVIGTQLNARQQEYFEQTTSYLDLLKHSLTKKEFDIVHSRFTKVLFMRLGSRSNSAWKLTDWVKLVIRILYDTVGIAKSDALILKINSSGSQLNLTVAKIFEDHSVNVAPKIIPSEEHGSTTSDSDENYRKLGEETKYEFMNPLFINNAGLIILAPYLGVLFERCGLSENGAFKDNEATYKAIRLLDYAGTGQTNAGEHELVLQKILCGVPVQNPVDISVEISEEQKAIVDDLLVAVTQQWPGLENTTIDSLRGSFLIRDGKLEETDNSIHLKVEQKPFDVLLDRIPWNISSIKLSWMPKLLKIEWR